MLVASWGPAHEEQVVAAIAAGKPVFCEKPLAPSSDACQRIMDAEMAAGRRLVQVGFMRRYDAGYRAMKAALDDGGLGAPLLMHCAHRNPSVPDYGFTTDMIISDSAVHEIDIVRWLFGEEIVAASVLTPRRSGHAPEGLQDPLILVLEMSGGALVDDELFVSARYGYDVRGEVVCETGTVALADVSEVTVRTQNRHSGRVPVDWRDRFIRAYDTELQEWLDAVAAGHVHRPDLLGRLRRRRGHGRRPRGAAHRPAHRGFHARTSGVLRQMKIALDPYMFRRVPLTDLPGAGRGPGLLLDRAVAARGLHAVLPAPAGGPGADRRVLPGPERGRRAGRLGAAAVPVVRPGRGRAPGRGAVLETGHPDHRRTSA